MRAAETKRPAAAGLMALLAMAGCTTAAGGPDPAALSAPTAASARPQFFIQWKTDLPGVTHRPGIAADSVLPDYPAAAVRDDLSGTTTLETCITVDGRLADARLAQSSGYDILDEATLAWARIAKFDPVEINGEPMAVCGYRFDQEWRVSE